MSIIFEMSENIPGFHEIQENPKFSENNNKFSVKTFNHEIEKKTSPI